MSKTAFNNPVLTVQNALVDMLAELTPPYPATVTVSRTLPQDGIDAHELPYIWVRRGRMLGRTQTSVESLDDVRQFQALLYVSQLFDGEQMDEEPFDIATEWIKPIHKHIAQNMRPAMASTIVLPDVRDTGDVNLSSKVGVRYAGVVFTIPVKISMEF